MLNSRFVAIPALLAITVGLYSCGKKEEPAPPPPAPAARAPADPAAPAGNQAASGGAQVNQPAGATPEKEAPARRECQLRDRLALKREQKIPHDIARSAPFDTQPPAQARPPARSDAGTGNNIDDAFSAIDNALKQTGSIAFNAPQTMNIKDRVKIQLLLSLAKTTERLKEELSQDDQMVGEQRAAIVKVAPEMEATLSGSNFEILAVTPEKQVIGRDANTEWQWEVKARDVGKHNLHLTLTAIVGSSKRAVRTFDEVITVEVTTGQRMTSFVKNNWQWLWTVVAAPPLAGLWTKHHKKSKRRKR